MYDYVHVATARKPQGELDAGVWYSPAHPFGDASDMHSNMWGHPARAEAEGVLEGVLDDRLLPRWGS